MPNCLRLLTLAWLHALPYLLFLERKKIFQGRLFDGKKNLCSRSLKAHPTEIRRPGFQKRMRNYLYKSDSARIYMLFKFYRTAITLFTNGLR